MNGIELESGFRVCSEHDPFVQLETRMKALEKTRTVPILLVQPTGYCFLANASDAYPIRLKMRSSKTMGENNDAKYTQETFCLHAGVHRVNDDGGLLDHR